MGMSVQERDGLRVAGEEPRVSSAREAWERSMWSAAYGEEWLRGLELLAVEGIARGLAMEVGSGELLTSSFAIRWNWGAMPRSFHGANGDETSASLLRGAWVLRTAPGSRDALLEVIEEIPELVPEGRHPTLHIEESPIVWLPRAREEATLWPGREAWLRASLFLDRPRRSQPAVAPESFEELVNRFLAPSRIGGIVRRPLDVHEARLRAFDRYRAAIAWDSDRPAYERAKSATGRRSSSSLRGGGTIPFLPHTVFAHDSRPAASPNHAVVRFSKEKRK